MLLKPGIIELPPVTGVRQTFRTMDYGISVYVNGSAVKSEVINHYASGYVIREVSTIEALAVNDYIEIHFFANAALTVTFSTVYTTFEVERIR